MDRGEYKEKKEYSRDRREYMRQYRVRRLKKETKEEANKRIAKIKERYRICRQQETVEQANERRERTAQVRRLRRQRQKNGNNKEINNTKEIQLKCTLNQIQQKQPNNEEKNKNCTKNNLNFSTIKLMEEIRPYIKQEDDLHHNHDICKSSDQQQKVKSNEPCKLCTGEIEKAYVEFLTKRMFLGKDYRRHKIIDYLKRDVPGLVKIKKEKCEGDEQTVQIFEDESNINLSLSERIGILQKFSLTEINPKYCYKSKEQKYTCIKTLAKYFNCNVEEVHKTLKRHIKYVKEWEDIKLYSPHSSFSIEDLDIILYFWAYECSLKNYPITINSIRHTAHPIAKLLDLEMFKASECWLDYFVNKYDIQLSSESPETLEQAAEAVRNIKLTNVVKKHSESLSKAIQEKYTVRRGSKPFTFRKRLKNSDSSHIMYSKVEQNYTSLKVNTLLTKIPEKKLDLKNSIENSIISNNIIKQEPNFEFIETDNFHENNLQDDAGDANLTSVENSINDVNIKQISNGIENKKRKMESCQPMKTNTAPNITIESYEDALKYLKPLEEFVMLKSNFRAINYLNCLQNVLKELNKS